MIKKMKEVNRVGWATNYCQKRSHDGEDKAARHTAAMMAACKVVDHKLQIEDPCMHVIT